jgi:hypothetical protein
MFGQLRAMGAKRSSARDTPPAVRVEAEREAERYLTDGINLYRVVDALRSPRGHAVVARTAARSS